MSLINKMLQDLEERQSGAEVLGPLHGHVRAAPERQPPGSARWIVLVAAYVAISGAAYGGIWWMNRQHEEKPAPAVSRPVLQPMQQPIASQPTFNLKLDHLPAGLPDTAGDAAMPSAARPVAETNNTRNDEQGAKDAEVAQFRPQEPLLTLRADPSGPKSALRSAPTSESPPRAKPSSEPKQERDITDAAARPIKAPSIAKEKEQAADVHDTAEDIQTVSMKVSKQVKELTPQQRAENEYRRALTLVEQGKTKDAASALEQALQIDPRHSTARQTLAALLIDGKRTDEALRKLSEGLALDRAQPGLAMMLARLQVDRQELRAAIETLQLSLPYAIERSDYRAFMAALLQRDACHKEAIDHYLAALKKAPNNGVWWMGIGISLQAENRIPEARDAFTRAKMSGSLSPELLAFVEQKLAQMR